MLLPDKDYVKVYEKFNAESEIEYASHFRMQIRAMRDGLCNGEKIGFLGKEGEGLEIRSGELSLIAGASGHGKSLFTGEVGLDFSSRGMNVCILSLEMAPKNTINRMVSQCIGKDATADEADACLTRFGKKIAFVNKVGASTPEFVYGAIITAVQQYECKQIIIDNLMKICDEFGDSAMNGQRRFIATLYELAKALDCHIWLVHHVRKSQNETDRIDKYSIRGATVITDQADNILLLSRNLMKEQEQRKDFSMQRDNDEPDSWLSVVKQRNGDWTGEIGLWYDTSSGCFCTSPSRIKPTFFGK